MRDRARSNRGFMSRLLRGESEIMGKASCTGFAIAVENRQPWASFCLFQHFVRCRFLSNRVVPQATQSIVTPAGESVNCFALDPFRRNWKLNQLAAAVRASWAGVIFVCLSRRAYGTRAMFAQFLNVLIFVREYFSL